MDEIQSAGGFLICVESRLAHQWRGTDGLSTRSDALKAGATTDYDRACGIPKKFLCPLPLRHGAALILGDMPLITGVWRNFRDQTAIWRIYCADPDDDVPSMLASVPEESYGSALESTEFAFGSRDIMIFDSALPGDEAKSESISFDVAPGRYMVMTHVVRATSRAELLVHRFHPIA